MSKGNYFQNSYEDRSQELTTMTEGISAVGMQNLHDSIKARLYEGVIQKLEETEEIQSALNKGWQGESRDKFLNEFSRGIDMVKSDLHKEYIDLAHKLGELTEYYYETDKEMII